MFVRLNANTNKQINKQTYIHQTNKQTNKHVISQTISPQKNSVSKNQTNKSRITQTNKQTNKRTNKQTLTNLYISPGTVPSYCQWETFNATCPDGHVILMTFAQYGRMRVGRCLSTDYYTGCQADVIDHMDERCSGKQTCTINIPDPKLFNVQPCRKDLVAYLEADYDCVPGK